MRINPQINTIKYYKTKNNNSGRDAVTRPSEVEHSIYQPNFTGMFSFLSKGSKQVANLVNPDLTVLSPRQIRNAKQNVINEIRGLFKVPYTPASSKRMDMLVNSPYVDYGFNCIGGSGFSLIDFIDMNRSTKENKLYNQFLRTSLAKTMPFELLEKDAAKNLYEKNNAIFHIFQEYTQMDETSKEAKEVRDMILRMKEHEVNIENYPEFFADCLYNGKTEMCKFLEKEFKINPETKVHVVKSNAEKIKNYKNCYGTSVSGNNPFCNNYNNTDSNFLVVYPQKLDYDNEHYWKIKNDTEEMNLWDFSALSPYEKAKEFFDIPKYIFTELKDKTYLDYGGSFSYPDHRPYLSKFLWNNKDKHPEISSLNFLENAAKYFRPAVKERIDANKYLSVITKNVYYGEGMDDEIFSLIKRLKFDYSKDSTERIKILEELFMMFGQKAGKTQDDLETALKSLEVSNSTLLGGNAFKDYENVNSLSMLNLMQKRELLEKLLNNKSNLLDCKLGNILNVKFLPTSHEEYCELVAKLSQSIGIHSKKLTPEIKTEFYNAVANMSKPNSEFMRLNFDTSLRRLNLDYPLEDFQKDIWYTIKDLSNIEKGKVLDYFGFELKNENGKLVMNGFPNTDFTEQRLTKIKDAKFLNKVKEIEPYVIQFTQANGISIKNNPEVSADLNSIIKAFPELLTTIGKLQSETHDFSLDIHTLKVLQEIFKNPEYQKLSKSSQIHLQLAALFHDFTKSAGVIDKSHPDSAAFDAYYITNKLGLPEQERRKIYQIVKNHSWLEQYLKNPALTMKETAFELRESDSFKLISILTDADLKSVKKDNKWYDKFKEDFDKAKAAIKPLIYDIQKTAINLPQTKIPKADKLNLDSPYVSKISSDGVVNTVVHLKQGINLKEAGFGENIALDDLNILVHGLDDKDSASMFQSLGIINSKALLSSSYINYGKGNWRVFRKQGFVLDVPSSDIHAGYWQDFGSGFKKDKSDLIYNYLFSPNKMRSYFSKQLKDELELSDDEYINLYRKIEDKSISELDKDYPKIASAYRNIFNNMEIKKRSNDRNYNEILITRPKIQAVFCYDKHPENIPSYLRMFAAKHNLPILVFE